MTLTLSPVVKLRKLTVGKAVIHVADDSVLAGGTKQRAAIPFLRDLQQAGFNRVVYASPPTGFAQIALARSCEAVGAECVIFAQSVDGAMSPFTAAIHKLCRVELFPTLAEAEEAATRETTAYKIPLGFDHPGYRQHLQESLTEQWQSISERIKVKRLWLPVGSGTLYRTFQQVVDCKIMPVDVRVLSEKDERLAGVSMRTPELFRDPCEIVPPIKSNLWYDAKLWRFILECGRSGDLWWNVAR